MYEVQEIEVYKPTYYPNNIGEVVKRREDLVGTIEGYIDLLQGTDQPTGAPSANLAFLEESTHIAIIPEVLTDISLDTNSILKNNGKSYEITHVDDPVGAGHHLEIYLKLMKKWVKK
jgi:hypothetical protein